MSLGLGLNLAGLPVAAAEVTALETSWLKAVWPVVAFARESRLPLDIVVQPQPAAGAAPIAMAFVEGRCKLVFTLRGNPEAQATLAGLAPELQNPALELMAAHELAHCRRHLDGAWYGLPAGLSWQEPQGLAPELQADYREMKAVRREEGYADLVGLAWTQQHHPAAYAALHAWLMAERSIDRMPGTHHDTVAWLRLASQGAGPADRSIFAAPVAIWEDGLSAEP
ncbi:MAG TPA: hypothetical protein VLA61_16230 [Ideonella sp.]|uniref:hypothetical protein n=1 Tax=Ideonella sp. TaxID=1929293 RepID=UPI002C8F7D3B|nr:hypothetical protein [Ideonella sp.]HSI49820.1 hypothetical protein [Ideonella sp.]